MPEMTQSFMFLLIGHLFKVLPLLKYLSLLSTNIMFHFYQHSIGYVKCEERSVSILLITHQMRHNLNREIINRYGHTLHAKLVDESHYFIMTKYMILRMKLYSTEGSET